MSQDMLNTYDNAIPNIQIISIAIMLVPCEPWPTYPEDEIKDEQQIFHAFHPALHFAHGSAWFLAISAPNACVLLCKTFPRLHMKHVMRLSCAVTSKHAHKAARGLCVAPPIRVYVPRWGLPNLGIRVDRPQEGQSWLSHGCKTRRIRVWYHCVGLGMVRTRTWECWW